jgi:hypothetical protein
MKSGRQLAGRELGLMHLRRCWLRMKTPGDESHPEHSVRIFQLPTGLWVAEPCDYDDGPLTAVLLDQIGY